MPASDVSKSTATQFGGITPIFNVRDLPASIQYYVDVLGFKVDWQAGGGFASVSRGRCGIFLCQGDQGNPGTWVWIGVEDCDRLFQEYSSKGANIRHRPTNYAWAYEMQIEDPDGNVLRCGSEPKTDQPFGEWLDMSRTVWAPTPNGGWARVQSG
jgi:catechol 2,3-dioxygenase-like lactoylglutathione lyase family enzyme